MAAPPTGRDRWPGIAVALLVAAAAGGIFPARAGATDAAESLPSPVRHEAQLFLSALRRQDSPAAATALQHLVEARHFAQIANLTSVAAAFQSRFQDAFRTDTASVRAQVARAALGLAPDDPGLRMTLARAELDAGGAGPGRAVSAAGDTAGALLRYPRGALVLVADAAFYTLASLLAVVTALAALLLFRHLPRLAHDVGDLFPSAPATGFSASEVARSRKARFLLGSGLARALARALVALLLFLPLACGLGLLGTASIWLVLVSLYGRRAEIAAAVLLLIGIGAIAPLGMLVNLPLAAGSAEGPRMWACLRETCSPEQARTISGAILQDPEAPWPRAALALHEIQGGPLRPSALQVAERHLTAARPDGDGAIATLLGNTRVQGALSGCPDGKVDAALLHRAVESYDAAAVAHGPSVPILRGKATAQGLLGDRAGQDATLQALVAVGGDEDLDCMARIRTLTSTADACQNAEALVRELRPPTIPDWTVYLSGVDPAAVGAAIPARTAFLGVLPPGALPFVALLALAAVIAAASLRRRFPLATSCLRCGTVSCPSCNTRESGFDYCPSCLMDQVRPAFVDPLDVVAIQRRRDAVRTRGRLLAPLLAVLLPGTGQVLAGRPIRGTLMLGLLAGAIALVLMPVPPLVDAVAFQGQSGSGLPVLPPILLGVVYSWSAVDVLVNRSR